MKNLKLNIIAVIIVMICCANSVTAQSVKNLPDNVSKAFSTKYQNASIKKSTVTNDGYLVKAKQDGQVFFASFDKNGQWTKTTSGIAWSWKLPATVNNAFKQSAYAAWRIDKLKKVETPNGDFYQVLVDNRFMQPDGGHAAFTENYVLSFKPEGELFDKQKISSTLLF